MTKDPQSGEDVMILIENYCKLRSIDDHLNSILELKNDLNDQFLPSENIQLFDGIFKSFKLNKGYLRDMRIALYKELEKININFDPSF